VERAEEKLSSCRCRMIPLIVTNVRNINGGESCMCLLSQIQLTYLSRIFEQQPNPMFLLSTYQQHESGKTYAFMITYLPTTPV
jgi:hypothetical protein